MTAVARAAQSYPNVAHRGNYRPVSSGEAGFLCNGEGAVIKKGMDFEREELDYLQTAVKRMIWRWQAQKNFAHADADERLERYQLLHEKIAKALSGQDGG